MQSDVDLEQRLRDLCLLVKVKLNSTQNTVEPLSEGIPLLFNPNEV